MNTKEEYRNNLKQGLSQYLLGMYTSYLEDLSEDEAKEIVSGVISDAYASFSDENFKEYITLSYMGEMKDKLANAFRKDMKTEEKKDEVMYLMDLHTAVEVGMDSLKRSKGMV